MPDLEEQLTALSVAIDWPKTPPHLWRGVRRSRMEGLQLNRWALAAVAALVIVGPLVAYTPSREAIAGWLNLHTTFLRTQSQPTPSPLPPGPLGERLGLGSPTTLDKAQSQVSWKIPIPAALGPPDDAYLQLPPTGPSGCDETLAYGQRPHIRTSGLT